MFKQPGDDSCKVDRSIVPSITYHGRRQSSEDLELYYIADSEEL